MEQIKVVFKIDKKNDNEIVAVFPFEVWMRYNYITCYSHIGQHCGCALSYAYELPLAKESEYANLLNEIKKIYYDCEVIVLNRMPRKEDVMENLCK